MSSAAEKVLSTTRPAETMLRLYSACISRRLLVLKKNTAMAYTMMMGTMAAKMKNSRMRLRRLISGYLLWQFCGRWVLFILAQFWGNVKILSKKQLFGI